MWLVWVLSIFLFTNLNAQVKSKNGWVLPAKGTIRVYMVFVEIDYGVENSKGTKVWPRGKLPSYKDDMFNVFEGEDSLKFVTKYYEDCSFGQLKVLGDYYPEVITLKHSDVGTSKTRLFRAAADIINAAESISSQELDFKDFDFWDKQTKRGTIKEESVEFSGIDHVMFFVRNFVKIPSQTGQAAGSSAALIGGLKTDSYSIFGGGDRLPFKIMKHELNHLFIGGNNFHSGGGNGPPFVSYPVALQGGWSMMGAANSSLLSVSGWDRMWLDWKAPGKNFQISATDEYGAERFADLTVENGSQTFILRDFVTTGDAIRIKQPFIPNEEYPQWIWLENHTTYQNNRVPSDRYSYEHHECMETAQPGLYLVRQIDANDTEGKKIYTKVKADYLKPIPANGEYDYWWEEEKVYLGVCVDDREHQVFALKDDLENPLSGSHGMEVPFYYDDSTKVIGESNMRRFLYRRNSDSSFTKHAFAGASDYAMHMGGVQRVGIGTNPSTAPTLTYVSSITRPSASSQSTRAIYLNGISIEILEVLDDLSLKVSICFDDTLINESRRWAGSEIVLNDHNTKGADLFIDARLTIDRGKTATRLDSPETYEGEVYFSSPTILIIESNAQIVLNTELEILKDSGLKIRSGGKLALNKKSCIQMEGEAHLTLEQGAQISGKGRIKMKDNAYCLVGDKTNYKKLRRRTWQKRRVIFEPPGATP